MSDSGPRVPERGDVPDELRERDQWLMFDTDCSEKQPHWRGNFGISWSDPDDWHSFGEAHEAAQERDSWGIGYVMASENDDAPRGIYGCIDLDGCVESEHQSGSKKEWVPSFEPLMAENPGFVEWSPSGEGLHIPLAGLEAPEWWSDCHLSDDEHEGVEVLTNKFVTVTGDKLRGTPDGVGDYDDGTDEWLAQAYKAVADEDPREPEDTNLPEPDGVEGGSSQSDEWFDADVAAEALSHIDADVSYPTWRDIGFALTDEFSTGRAKRLFKKWSRGGRKWDTDAERQAERIIDDGSSGGGRTIATVVHAAKKGGWDASQAARENTTTTEADGGTSVAQPQGSSPENGAAAGEGDDGTVWETIQQKYSSKNTEQNKLGRLLAAERVDEREHLAALLDTENLWRFDPETGVYESDAEARVGSVLDRGLQHHYSGHERREILDRLRQRHWTKRDEMGAENEKVVVGNGMLDLTDPSDPTLEGYDPELKAVRRLAVNYDEDADCPEFKQFLGEAVEDADRKKLQEYAGYTLETWAQSHKRALCLVGPTDAGKGVFLDVIREVLGRENTASENLYDLTDTRWATANLYGSVANIENELSTDDLKSPEKFKKLTGGADQVTAERKGEQKFTFLAKAKHLFATNQLPSVEDSDTAFYNRWLFASFPTTVPAREQDPELAERIIENEASGVLNWMLEGYARLCRQGGFSTERRIDEKESMWQAHGDSTDRFVAHCLRATEDKKDVVATHDAYAAYEVMCADLQMDPEPKGNLTERVKEEPHVSQTQRRGTKVYTADPYTPRVYSGVQLTEEGWKYLDAARTGGLDDDGGEDDDGERQGSLPGN